MGWYGRSGSHLFPLKPGGVGAECNSYFGVWLEQCMYALPKLFSAVSNPFPHILAWETRFSLMLFFFFLSLVLLVFMDQRFL